MPRHYPPDFRRKVLDLVAAGRPVAQVAADLDISAQAIYTCRRSTRGGGSTFIDTGQVLGIISSDQVSALSDFPWLAV